MENKLILNPMSFPNKFNDIEITVPQGKDKIQFVEEKIIEKINQYNIKLNLDSIIYEDINSQFSKVKTSNYTGAIVKDTIISSNRVDDYKKSGFYVFEKENQIIARNIIEYVYISSPSIESRNSAISQVIFPTHTEFMNEFINSPSYYVADHKFMFINIYGKPITAQTIIRHISSLILIGFDYVEIFNNSINKDEIPRELKSFIEKFNAGSKYNDYYDYDNQTFNNHCYKIDFKNKQFYLDATYLDDNIIQDKNSNKYCFHGSSEKFLWMEIYPVSILAFENGFEINYEEFEEKCNEKYKLLNQSDKIVRCMYLLNYIKKYISKI